LAVVVKALIAAETLAPRLQISPSSNVAGSLRSGWAIRRRPPPHHRRKNTSPTTPIPVPRRPQASHRLHGSCLGTDTWSDPLAQPQVSRSAFEFVITQHDHGFIMQFAQGYRFRADQAMPGR